MKCYHLDNNTAVAVKDSPAPWEFNRPRPALRDKAAFRAWCLNPNTQHYFYSTFEGLNPFVRISKENPAYRMHGLVADYDSRIPRHAAVDLVLKNSPPEFRPAWVSTTFSGGTRLVWEFEQPVFTHNAAALKSLLGRVKTELKIAKLCPGLDDILFKPDQYYELGTDWTRISEARIDFKTLAYWQYQTGTKVRWSVEGTEIPLELVAAEIEKQYPGRWPGPFQEGARGPRFWDPTADNDTAAVVRSAGMQCFTGDTPFVPWATILGAGFTRDFQANRIASSTDQIYYDNRHYWQKDENGSWFFSSLEGLQLHLRVAAQLSRDPGRSTHSEVDAAVYHIQRKNRVIAALPFVHRTKGLHREPDGLYLNTSNISVCPPIEGTQTWGEDFPWLAKFFEGYWATPDQADFFFAWLQRFYKSAYEARLQPGHTIFIAGKVGQGKTLLGTKIVGPMLGGASDATNYLLGKSAWNDFLFSRAVWNVDDPEPGKDPKAHAIYSAALKKHVANQEFDYQQKFRDGGRVTWTGRTIVTLNDDEISLGMLPEMDISIMDKIMLFRTADRDLDFTDCEEHITRELPFFCRWLLDWKAPAHTVGKARYGVKEYHDDFLLNAAHERGRAHEFRDLMEMFLVDWFRDSEDQEWVGTSANLYINIMQSPAKECAKRLTPHQLTRNLKMLLASGEPNVALSPGRSRRPMWVIKRAFVGTLADEVPGS